MNIVIQEYSQECFQPKIDWKEYLASAGKTSYTKKSVIHPIFLSRVRQINVDLSRHISLCSFSLSAFHRCSVFCDDLLNRTKKNRDLNCVGVNTVLIFPIHDLNIRHKKIRSWQSFQDVTWALLSLVISSRMEDHTNNVTRLSGVADQTTVC